MRTRMMAAALGAAAAAACGQGTMQFYWDLNGEGTNEIAIAPDDTVNLRLYVLMDPTPVIGFADAIYDIVGLHDWDSGEITLYENKFGAITDDGELQANNDILDIESFQLPPFFNPEFDRSNPVWLYEIEWTPDDYTARIVEVTDANHVVGAVYTDDFGSSVEYEILPSDGARIFIVPAPAGLVGLGLGLAAGMRRARRA